MTAQPSSPAVTCPLGAGMHGQVERWRALLEGVEPEAVDGGPQYRLPIARIESAARVAVDEQVCCPFFSFGLSLQGEPFVLAIRTPPEGASMLAEISGHPAVTA